eukprot:3938708-Rhodomonas_salina.1
MQQHMSSYKATFIINAGQALFVRYKEMREENRAANVAARTAKTVPVLFRGKVDEWNTPEDLASLTKHFDGRESGKSITRLSVIKSTILKDTFGTADPD